jgi:hypothetical protein
LTRVAALIGSRLVRFGVMLWDFPTGQALVIDNTLGGESDSRPQGIARFAFRVCVGRRTNKMDWPTFISNMTSALAWPVVVGGIAYFYRTELRQLFSGMKRLKLGPMEAEMFELRAKETRIKAEALPPHSPSPQPSLPGQSTSDEAKPPADPQPPTPTDVSAPPDVDDRLMELLSHLGRGSERWILLDVWNMVEDSLRSLAERIGVNAKTSVVTMLLELRRQKAISNPEYEVLRSLFSLRNELGTTMVTPGEETVVEYAAAASTILRRLGFSDRPGRSAQLRSVPLAVHVPRR